MVPIVLLLNHREPAVVMITLANKTEVHVFQNQKEGLHCINLISQSKQSYTTASRLSRWTTTIPGHGHPQGPSSWRLQGLPPPAYSESPPPHIGCGLPRGHHRAPQPRHYMDHDDFGYWEEDVVFKTMEVPLIEWKNTSRSGKWI